MEAITRGDAKLAMRVSKPCWSFASPMQRMATQSSRRSPCPIYTIYKSEDADLNPFVRLFMLLMACRSRAAFSAFVRTATGRLQIQTASLKMERSNSSSSMLSWLLSSSYEALSAASPSATLARLACLMPPLGPEIGTERLL
jgi:hypothetical protein